MMKTRKRKILAFCVMVIAIMLFTFSTAFATDVTETQTPDSTYWKVIKYEEIKDYRTTPETIDGYLFAGWFTDESCAQETAISSAVKEGTAYAKYVPEEILGLKAQVNDKLWNTSTTDDEMGAIRFVTSVDSLDYAKVGFMIDIGNGEKEKASNIVYETLCTTIGDAGYEITAEYEPKDLFHASSVYFKSWTVTDVPELNYITQFTVTPFWITLDGTTIKGTTSFKTVNQGRSWEYVFVDDEGSDETGTGTRNYPYQTLDKALSEMETYRQEPYIQMFSTNTTDGIVYVSNSLTADSSFAWKDHDLDVTITGDTTDTDSEKIDFSALTDLNMGDAATFSDLTMIMPQEKIYANGHRLEIEQNVNADTTNTPNVYGGSKTTTVENTDVTLLTGSYGNIYSGGNSGAVTGDTNLYIGGDIELSSKTVWGGCYNSTVSGDTHVTIGGNAKVQYVRGAGNSTNQKVEGTCYVTIQDNAVIEGVNGGGANGTTNNTYVVVKGGTIEQVFGGQTTSGGTVNNTNVYILGGTVTRRIYGGSYNEYNSGWQSECYVNGYSNVSIGKNVKLDMYDTEYVVLHPDYSLCAVSRYQKNFADETSVMIVNSGAESTSWGYNGTIEDYVDDETLYTHFLINVEEDGSVTSESGILRIIPNDASTFATVKDSNGNVLFQCQGEGTYSLSGLTTPTDMQTLTVTFSDSATLTGNYVLSYGDNSNSYFNSLTDALAAVSTPNIDGAGTQKTATITISEENVTVDSTLALTNNKNVVLQNATDKSVTITRGTSLTDASMFDVASGCSLTIGGTIVLDGNKDNVQGPSMITNAGTFVLDEDATLQNASTTLASGDNGAALYNTGIANIYGNVTGNSAYKGGAIYTTGAATVSGNVIGNTSSNQGGAIYVTSAGSVNLTSDGQAEISGNTAGHHGGAIYVAGVLTADQYQFNGNTSTNSENNNARGGAIHIEQSTIAEANLTNCIFGAEGAKNASAYGGAVFSAGRLSVENCKFQYNTSKTSGGAVGIYDNSSSYNTEAVITDSTFTSNESKAYGGAIDVNGGSDQICIKGCSFSRNDNVSGGTISVRATGKHLNISDLTFTGDYSENADVIYLAAEKNTVGISGKISKAIIQSAAKEEATAQILINGYLEASSDITLTPTTYSNAQFVLAKANDEVANAVYKNGINIMKVTQPAGEYWVVQNTGHLSDVVATINGTEGSYKDALAAIADTTSGALTIKFLRSIEIADTITIPTGADVTITNATGKNVTITRTCETSLFSVASGSTLSIGSEDTANKLVVDGGYVADTENPLEAQSLVSNAGNFVLEANATIQNAVTDGTNSYLGGALNNAANAQATINGTICGCSAYNGGAIYNDTNGEVNITASARFVDNIANGGNGGAIRNKGSLTIIGASFSGNKGVGTTYGNGGAIYNTGKLISQDATYEENTARSGGAVYNESSSGTLNITGGNFTKNSAAITSGSGGTGGAVYVKAKSGSISFVNVEFTKNSSTSNQSAAIDAQATITLTSCNIHDNVSSENSSNAIYDVRIGSATLNVEDDTRIDAVYYQPDETGMVAVGETFTGDIVLVPNDYTVGTQLVTFAAGITDTTSVASKLVVGKVISGQVYQANAYYVDTKGLLQEYVGVAKVGNVSYDTLAEAIEAVDTEEETTICLLSNAEFNGTIAIGDESTNKNITIINSNGEDIAITRTEASSMISVADGSSLTIAGNETGSLTLDGNKELATPHLISNEGTFVMEKGVTIQNAITAGTKNDEAYNGGALFNTGSATLKGIFKGCYGFNGGAVFNDKNAEMQVIGATFTNNISKGNGGAIRNQGALTVEKSNFDTNISEDYNGGAIYTDTADFEVTNTTFSNNTASKSGGAIYADTAGTKCTIKNCDFSANTATSGTGGAVRATNSLTITGGTYTDNKAATGGGAVEVAGTGIISGVEMYDNSLTTTSGSTFYGGGAIYVTSGKKLTLSDSNIYNNTSNHETVPSCDISSKGTLTLTGIKADDENEATTEQCLVYQSNTLYYVGEDGEMLNEKQ